MDARNSLRHPACHPTGTDHEQVLPMVARPPDWTINYPAPHNNHPSYHHPPPAAPSSSPPLPISTHISPPSMVSSTHDETHASRTNFPAQQPRQDGGKNHVTKVRKPRKSNNAAGGRSTLFWVHTDPQSVSEGTREETLKRIRSHVMSEHNRKKRLENTKRYKSKTWKHLAFQPVETAASSSSSAQTATFSASTSQELSVRHSSPHRSHVSSSESSPESSSSPEQLPVKLEEPESALEVVEAGEYIPASSTYEDDYKPISTPQSQSQALTIARSSSPLTYIGQGAKDPFNMSHTPLSDRMFRHLQHFLCNLTRMAYPLQRRYGARLEAHWAALVQHDPASLHACICVAATNSALETGEFPLTDPNKQRSSVLLLDTFHHRGETIRLVNEGLSDPIKAASDELIAAVSILLTIEIASGNPDYLKIHLAGLRQMVSMRNSFADVPHEIRFQISWTDIRVACMSLTKPIFPFVRYTHPKYFTITPPYKELEATASSLMTLIEIPGIFNDVMSKIICDLAALVWYAEWIKTSYNFQDFDEETECYYNTEVLYVEYTLHSDRYTSTGEVKGDATIEGCVRLACLLFHNSAIWDFYPQIAPVFPKPIIALQVALESTIRAGCYHLCRDLLIWLLFIGACSSRLEHQRSFFVNELASAVRLQGIRSWQELRSILLGYFYVDRCYLVPLRELWDEIQTVTVSQ